MVSNFPTCNNFLFFCKWLIYFECTFNLLCWSIFWFGQFPQKEKQFKLSRISSSRLRQQTMEHTRDTNLMRRKWQDSIGIYCIGERVPVEKSVEHFLSRKRISNLNADSGNNPDSLSPPGRATCEHLQWLNGHREPKSFAGGSGRPFFAWLWGWGDSWWPQCLKKGF